MQENNFYVYLHRRKTDNKVFYVGKGRGKRAWATSGRNPHWCNVKKKHGCNVEIVFDGLSESEAFQAEIDTILEMEYFSCHLVNKTKGGEGVTGHVHSEETRKKLSAIGIGRRPTDEAIAKIVKKNTGKKRSEEIKAKFKVSQAWRRKPLFCSNGMVFDGVKDAISWVQSNTQFKTANHSAVSVAATKKENGCAYMLRWSYQKESLGNKMQIESRFRGKIKCSNGMIFENMKSAIEWLRCNGFEKATFGKISSVCKKSRKTAYKLSWEYIND